MVNAWPGNVPTTAAGGSLTERFLDDSYRFEPDIGEPLTRDASTIIQSVVEFDTIPISSAVWSSLQTFYYANRSLIFTRVHPDPEIIGTNYWKFEAPPKRKHSFGGFHVITLALRLLPSS